MNGKKTVLGILVLVFAYYLNKTRTRTKQNGKIVATTTGNVQGIISVSRDGREFYEWLGIPYAKPPVRDLRFARPQPLDKWTGVRDAKEYGNPCIQLNLFRQIEMGHEDCLFLNIHVPKEVPKGKLVPVMIFFHGGYFAGGTSNIYRPDYFMDENVVLVTLNYRLGAFGFLNAGRKSIRGNMGLADQALAIKWISQNIDRFGPIDPKKITIFGQSAGGASVNHQLLYMKNEGLINSAISQSGTAINPWAIYENPIEQAKEFAERVKCPTENREEMVTCLKNADVVTLIEGHRAHLDPLRKKSTVFVPTVETIVDDETFLSEHPSKLMAEGKFLRVPWLIGYNEDEGLMVTAAFFANETFRSKAGENWADFAEPTFILSPKQKMKAEAIRDFYFQNDRKLELDSLDSFEQLTLAMTDRFFLSGIVQTAESVASFTSVYTYYYNKTGPSFFNLFTSVHHIQRFPNFPPAFASLCEAVRIWLSTKILRNPDPFQQKSYGVCHGDELAQLFHMPGLFFVGKDDSNYEFSKDLIKFFVQFANDPSTGKFRGISPDKHEPKKPLRIIELSDMPKTKQLLQIPNMKERLEFWKGIEKLNHH